MMMRGTLRPTTRKAGLGATVAASVLCATAALAPAKAEDAAAAPASPYKFGALVDTGIYATNHDSNINAGQSFTDKNRQWVLNQAMLTAEKDLDPAATGYDWGFKAQGFYGADARYTHFIGLFDHNTSDRNQFDITEANLQGHAPWLTQGGIDVKAGLYSTPIGYEVIQANSNPLYSHSYIFNYALPFKHMGVLSTTHVNSTWDVYLGADSGLNMTTTQRGQTNGHWSGLAGVGLNNLADGKLTILALSHFGPAYAETRVDQPAGTVDAAHQGRYIFDLVATYKPTDLWTWVTELNYNRDDLFNTKAFGIAQYGMYQWNSWLTLVGRAEIFADPQSGYVASFQGNRDPVNAERGITPDYGSTLSLSANRTSVTYGALTFGANVKLPDMPAMLDGTMLRPEVRFDRSLNGVNAFAYGDDQVATAKGVVSAGMDLVIPVGF